MLSQGQGVLKKALDWLNDNTTDDVSFYGIQVEVWKIDDSRESELHSTLEELKEQYALEEAKLKELLDE